MNEKRETTRRSTQRGAAVAECRLAAAPARERRPAAGEVEGQQSQADERQSQRREHRARRDTGRGDDKRDAEQHGGDESEH